MKYTVLNINDGVAVLGINRPDTLNALNGETASEIGKCIDIINSHEEVRVMILYSPKNFAAGADISEMVRLNSSEASKYEFSSSYNKIEKMEIPTISAIEGYALGGGMELALTTDIRFAGKKSKMGFPEVSLGLFPGAGGSIRLPKIIGPALAKEMIFSGNVIDAQRAEEIGLVNRVVDDDKVFEEAMRLARTIISRSPLAVRTAKKSIAYAENEMSVEKASEFERRAWVNLFDSEEKREGMTAFLEKRKPDYSKF